MTRILFDLSGLVQWYAYLSNPSGIQRVMENILGQRNLAGAPQVTFGARALGSDTFYAIDPLLVRSLLTASQRRETIGSLRGLFGASMRQGQPTRLLQELRAIHIPYIALGASFTEWLWARHTARRWLPRRPLVTLDTNQGYNAIIGLGDFWCHEGHVDSLISLKRRTGARLIHLIHDLVAVVHPQWTHPHYGQQFVSQLGRLAPHIDHWLATSNYVANQLAAYLKGLDLATTPIDTIPIGWPHLTQRPGDLVTDGATLQKYGLQRNRYILHVGTVEPRKNLPVLLDALAGLPAEAAGSDLPCILVGRDGWRSEVVRERLKNDQRLAGRVRWIQDAPDAELNALYRSARFTVVPSLDEGWGLAVQESLAHGTPCIASQVGGIPEASRGLAKLVPGNDVLALQDAINTLAASDGTIELARQEILTALAGQSLPSWANAAEAILRAAGRPFVHGSADRFPGL